MSFFDFNRFINTDRRERAEDIRGRIKFGIVVVIILFVLLILFFR